MFNDTGLAITSLSGGYGRRVAIENISCHIPKGQITLMVGRNGSGKSTLLRAIMGLLPVRSGRIYWQGTKLSCPTHKMRHKGIVYIPQRRSFFTTLNILTNLELACAKKARNQRRKLIDSALQKFPFLRNNTRRIGGSLSGGERKQLALACGTVVTPGLLLADEPLAGLSPSIRENILEHLRRAAKEMEVTIILVEHDVLNASRIADRVIALRLGRLVAECTSSEFDEVVQRKVFLE